MHKAGLSAVVGGQFGRTAGVGAGPALPVTARPPWHSDRSSTPYRTCRCIHSRSLLGRGTKPPLLDTSPRPNADCPLAYSNSRSVAGACKTHAVMLNCRQMRSLQIRDVPDSTHSALRRRAAEAGMSLQEYVLSILNDFASRPTVVEVITRAGGRAGGKVGLARAAADLRAERARR